MLEQQPAGEAPQLGLRRGVVEVRAPNLDPERGRALLGPAGDVRVGADDPAAGLGGGDLRADLVPGVGAIQGVRQVAGQRCGPLTGLVSRRMLTSPLRRIL